MSDLKKIMKSLFPNIFDIIRLRKQKKTDKKKIDYILGIDESNYPILLQSEYKKRTGHELNLKEPQRFTEKIQWRKLYDHNPSYSVLSDKYAVREWVKKKIGAEFIIPLIGVWDSFDDIDFSKLPDQFVLKTNNASHTNIVVTDKKKFMRRKWSARKQIEYWLKVPFALIEGLELHYLSIKPQIIAEEYIKPLSGKNELVDYKFHCFNGVPVLCQVISGRFSSETIDFYDMNWSHISLTRPPYPNANSKHDKPPQYELMVQLATKLSEGFKYVRVDLYDNDDTVYFGELTFTPASGMMKFEPDEWDYRLGKLWDINSKQVDNSKIDIIGI